MSGMSVHTLAVRPSNLPPPMLDGFYAYCRLMDA